MGIEVMTTNLANTSSQPVEQSHHFLETFKTLRCSYVTGNSTFLGGSAFPKLENAPETLAKPRRNIFQPIPFPGTVSSAFPAGKHVFSCVSSRSFSGASPTWQVLKWEDVDVGEPSEGEVRVKHKAIGVNFIDVYFRKGVYKVEKLPFTPGMEAVGVVTAVGPGLVERKVGDLVAYAGNSRGSYTEEQILPASVVVPVPPAIDPVSAAAILLKGMTAQFLLRRCFKVEPRHTILVHAAAGGVGSLLCQWGSALGATVIGTVSSKEKAAQATEDGCHHPVLYNQENFVDRVKEITKGQGVQVVYDSVGKDTFQGSLECLAFRGYMVSFGQSSGIPDPVPLSSLAPKSLFLTRPTMMHYTATRDELLATAEEVFANVASGVLKVRVNHTYPLSEAAKAHADLEGRKTTGSVVLIPDAN